MDMPTLKCSGGSPGGGGFRGFKPPPLGCQVKIKNLMCIEKRHHYVQTHTVCSYSTLSQAQPQTIGFKPPPPPLSRCHAGKHHLRGFKIAPKKKSVRRFAARGRCSASSLGQTPPPWKKARSAPQVFCRTERYKSSALPYIIRLLNANDS